MNKIIIIILIIVLIIIAIIFTFNINNVNKNIKDPKYLELTYELNAGIPFKWEVEIDDEEVVEFVKSYVVRDDNEKGALTGASVYTNYVFKGLKEGKTTITFKLVNFADNYVSDSKKHIVKVDKDKNITLVSSEK